MCKLRSCLRMCPPQEVGTEVRALAASSGSDFAPEREQDVLRATGSQANAVLGCKARSSAAAVVPGPPGPRALLARGVDSCWCLSSECKHQSRCYRGLQQVLSVCRPGPTATAPAKEASK